MPGIADAPVTALQTGNTPAQVAEFSVTPGVGDMMAAFKSGFITTEDITKRAAEKPLEQAQRQQALADTNLIRPKQRELAAKQMDVAGKQADIQSKSLETQATAQPKLDAASLIKAEQILTEAQRGNDKGAVLTFYQQVTSPGQMPPKLSPDDPDSDYDYAKIEQENRAFLKNQRELQAAGNLSKFVKTFSSQRTTPTGGTQNLVTRMDERSGQILGQPTVISESPKDRVPLKEAEINRLSQADIAAANIKDVEVAFDNLVKNHPNLVGPVAGRTIGPAAGEYNAYYQQLENAITKTVPGLARGVFGEVGVLTDRDVERYTKLLPSAKKDPTVAKAILKDVNATVQRARGVLLDNYERNGSDVTRFRGGVDSTTPAASAAPAPATPTGPDVPVKVNSPAEAPATARLIQAPDGRIFKNPNYKPTTPAQ